jgi:CheY-like chemotaxis protein
MYLQQVPKIFIVEDNLLYQQMIAREMEAFGGEVFFFTRGEHCVDSLPLQPSIIILDYNLEGEMNGLETLAEIRRFDPSIFVILFSNQKEVNSRENVKRYGAFKFVEKQDQSFSVLRQLVSANMSL